eukprot:scaffold1138_cov128-Cylindrotheca_fusiformis.AAC.38
MKSGTFHPYLPCMPKQTNAEWHWQTAYLPHGPTSRIGRGSAAQQLPPERKSFNDDSCCKIFGHLNWLFIDLHGDSFERHCYF